LAQIAGSLRQRNNMPKSIVYAARPDRLGGRLSAIVNAKRLADKFDLDLKVLWSKPKNAYPELMHPEAIFSQDFIDAHFLPVETTLGELKFTPMAKPAALQSRPAFVTRAAPDSASKFVPLVRRAKLGTMDGFEARIKLAENFGFTTREGAVALPFEDEKSAQLGFSETFSRLDFSDAFQVTMGRIDEKLADGQTYVGVHIRRGDVIRNQNTSEGFWYGQYVPDLVYFTALDEFTNSNARLIFFCDDNAVLDTFMERYPDAVSGTGFCAIDDQPALHVDLAEMYLLSRCARVLCPRSSAFSLVAADLSAAPHEPIEDLLSHNQMNQAIDGLVDQLNRGVEAFHSVGDFKQSLNALVSYYQRGLTDLSPIAIARIAREQQISTVTVMEMALVTALNTKEREPLVWLAQMVQNYPVPHVSALGDCFALLACGEDFVGEHEAAQRHLIWANWLNPESKVCSAITSVLAKPTGAFSNAAYVNEGAKLHLPVNKGLQFLTNGNRAEQFDKRTRHAHYVAGFIMMDWLEFLNPKTRKRVSSRSTLPHKLDANLSESLAALDQVFAKRSKPDLTRLQEQHAVHPDDPIIAKRLATGYFLLNEVPKGLNAMHVASDLAQNNPAFKAAYAVRLSEFGRDGEAIALFEELACLHQHWINDHPAVVTAHAQACFATKDYATAEALISRNLEVARSCKVSLTLHNQLQKFI
jgi:hypothetical protein